MASPGLGHRTAADILCEVSLHLLQPIVFTDIVSVVGPGGYGTAGYGGMPPPPAPGWGYGSGPPEVITPASLDAMYVGAQIIVGWGLDTAEVVTITGIDYTHGVIYTTAFVNSHSAGEKILAPTFPYQQPTDPAYSQSEMLGYLGRAQNELLAAAPVYYELSTQALVYGQLFQNTPANCIEINRVAISQTFIALASLVRYLNVVTLTSVDPHGLGVRSTIYVQNSSAGWGGTFEVLTVPSPTTLTYRQIASDDSTTGGSLLYWRRMYETTQAELTQTNRTWQNGYVTSPNAWYEDRTGLYRWGVSGRPASNYPVELLCSVRDSDTLSLLDGLLVPDILAYIVKYKVLEYCLSKNGVQQDPARARYCKMRFDKGVAAIQRYLEGFDLTLQAKQG